MASTSRREMLGFRVTEAQRRELEFVAVEEGHKTLAAYLRAVVLADARRRLRARVLADPAEPASGK